MFKPLGSQPDFEVDDITGLVRHNTHSLQQLSIYYDNILLQSFVVHYVPSYLPELRQFDEDGKHYLYSFGSIANFEIPPRYYQLSPNAFYQLMVRDHTSVLYTEEMRKADFKLFLRENRPAKICYEEGKPFMFEYLLSYMGRVFAETFELCKQRYNSVHLPSSAYFIADFMRTCDWPMTLAMKARSKYRYTYLLEYMDHFVVLCRYMRQINEWYSVNSFIQALVGRNFVYVSSLKRLSTYTKANKLPLEAEVLFNQLVVHSELNVCFTEFIAYTARYHLMHAMKNVQTLKHAYEILWKKAHLNDEPVPTEYPGVFIIENYLLPKISYERTLEKLSFAAVSRPRAPKALKRLVVPFRGYERRILTRYEFPQFLFKAYSYFYGDSGEAFEEPKLEKRYATEPIRKPISLRRLRCNERLEVSSDSDATLTESSEEIFYEEGLADLMFSSFANEGKYEEEEEKVHFFEMFYVQRVEPPKPKVPIVKPPKEKKITKREAEKAAREEFRRVTQFQTIQHFAANKRTNELLEELNKQLQ